MGAIARRFVWIAAALMATGGVAFFFPNTWYVPWKSIEYGRYPVLYQTEALDRRIEEGVCTPFEALAINGVEVGDFRVTIRSDTSLDIRTTIDGATFFRLDQGRYLLLVSNPFDFGEDEQAWEDYRVSAGDILASDKLPIMRELLNRGALNSNYELLRTAISVNPGDILMRNDYLENKFVVRLLELKGDYMATETAEIFSFEVPTGYRGYIFGEADKVPTVTVAFFRPDDKWLRASFRNVPQAYIDCFVTDLVRSSER